MSAADKPRQGHGVEERYQPFTYQNAVSMLVHVTNERGGITPSCWYVDRERGDELIGSMREADIRLSETDKSPTIDDFEYGRLMIFGVPILPLIPRTRPSTGRWMTCGRRGGWPRALFEQMFGKNAQEFRKMAERK